MSQGNKHVWGHVGALNWPPVAILGQTSTHSPHSSLSSGMWLSNPGMSAPVSAEVLFAEKMTALVASRRCLPGECVGRETWGSVATATGWTVWGDGREGKQKIWRPTCRHWRGNKKPLQVGPGRWKHHRSHDWNVQSGDKFWLEEIQEVVRLETLAGC